MQRILAALHLSLLAALTLQGTLVQTRSQHCCLASRLSPQGRRSATNVVFCSGLLFLDPSPRAHHISHSLMISYSLVFWPFSLPASLFPVLTFHLPDLPLPLSCRVCLWISEVIHLVPTLLQLVPSLSSFTGQSVLLKVSLVLFLEMRLRLLDFVRKSKSTFYPYDITSEDIYSLSLGGVVCA